MYYHYRKTRLRYNSFPKHDACPFCEPHVHSEIIEETPQAYVIPNRVFYDLWELRKVVDHKMIIPRRHVLSLGDLNAAERTDIMNLIAKYESLGYEVYARSPVSHSRSLPHQHTHLIKTTGKPGRMAFFLKRPYILWRLP